VQASGSYPRCRPEAFVIIIGHEMSRLLQSQAPSILVLMLKICKLGCNQVSSRIFFSANDRIVSGDQVVVKHLMRCLVSAKGCTYSIFKGDEKNFGPWIELSQHSDVFPFCSPRSGLESGNSSRQALVNKLFHDSEVLDWFWIQCQTFSKIR
jgi:hypothetical protein